MVICTVTGSRADGIRDDLDDIVLLTQKDWAIDHMPSVDRNLPKNFSTGFWRFQVDVAVAINEVVDPAAPTVVTILLVY